MTARKDLTGQRFGRLIVLGYDHTEKGYAYWKCRCSCNSEVVVSGNALKSGRTQSCGCLLRELSSKRRMKNLVGQRFGRLLVTGLEGKQNYGGRERCFWTCVCLCGKTVSVCSEHLTRGAVRSCGCLQQENRVVQGKKRGTHYLGNSRIYSTWQSLKDRCYNPNNNRYKRYGGRGITVYEPWVHDFQAFYEYVSQLEHFGEDGYSLDRIDNDGNYEPGNLRWADIKTQNRNRSGCHIVEYEGQPMTVAEAAEKSGLPAYLLYQRIGNGWSGDCLFAPNQGQIQKGAPPKK